MLLVALTIVGAGVTGFVLYRLIVPRLRARWQDGINPEGLTTADLIRPMQALVVLLLTFVLFQTFASYQRANESASQEAALARIDPSEMELTEQRIGETAERADPPCDERGALTGAG